jgi:hypothetical protein
MLLNNLPYRRTRPPHRPLRRRLLLELLEARNLLSFTNVLVNNPALDTTAQDTQSETAITLGTGSKVIVAYNDSVDAVAGNYLATGHSLSADGGATFQDQGNVPYQNVGDPTLARSAKTGTVFLSTIGVDQSYANPSPPPPILISGQERINVSRSTDNGANFSNPVNGTPGLVANVDYMDKPWIAVDNFPGPGYGNVYLAGLDSYYPPTGPFSLNMLLTRSTDDGLTWGPSGGTQLTSSVYFNPFSEGPNVTVGPDHAVYAFWYNAKTISFHTFTVINPEIVMRKSIDQGVTFSDPVTVTKLRTDYVDGDLGLTDSAGNSFQTNAFPQAVVNPVTGDIYVAYDDWGNGSGKKDKGNIYFTQSSDGGQTWSDPVQVNDDHTNNDQWFPALAVTPDGSHVGLFWYDRRLDPANNLIDRFGAIGSVSGHTVSFAPNFRITDVSFPPVFTYFNPDGSVHTQDPVIRPGYMGDYDQAVADDNYFYTTWGDNRLSDAAHANQPDVRFAKIPVGCEETDSSLAALAAISSAASVADPSALPSSQASSNGLAVDAYFMDFVRTSQTIGSVTRGDLATWPYSSLAPPFLPGTTDQVVTRSAQVSSMLTPAPTHRAAYGLADDWATDVLRLADPTQDAKVTWLAL